MKKIMCFISLLSLGMLLVTFGSGVSFGGTTEPVDVLVKQGALIYDKWYQGQQPPEGSHPLYPSVGKKQGASSWRCKECHGWDYVGSQGRYSKGSHFTGIEGVLHARDWTEEKLIAALSSGKHDFSTYMTTADMQALSRFLQKGTIDTSLAIGENGIALGSASTGEPLYQKNCAGCHGSTGKAFDFNPKKEGAQGIGWLARDNPQETLHKIRWGHPGSGMPSMIVDKGLTERQVVDLMAYAQTLD